MRWKGIVMLLLLLISVFLAGCWDYLEIERLTFVLGIGVEQIEPDFDMTIEAIKAGGGAQGSNLQSVVLTNKGQTFFSTGRLLTNLAGKRLFWAHAKVFIVSEDVARRGMVQAIELAVRDPDIRTSILVFVAKDCTVEEIYQSKPPVALSVTEHIVDLVELRHRVPVSFPQEIWQFRISLAESGVSAVLPAIQLVHEGVDKVPVLEGSAIFKGEQMVGWLDGQETRFFALLMNETDRGPVVIPSLIHGQRGNLTYQIEYNQVKIRPVVEGDQLGMAIDLKLQIDLSESGTLRLDFDDSSVIKALEEEFCVAVKGQIQSLLQKIQREYNTDVFGFGRLLKRKHPEIWRVHANDWDEVFKHLKVTVNVDAEIVSTGILSKAIHLRN